LWLTHPSTKHPTPTVPTHSGTEHETPHTDRAGCLLLTPTRHQKVTGPAAQLISSGGRTFRNIASNNRS